MNLSRNWLADFVDVSDIDNKAYSDRMTDTGSKVEGFEVLAEDIENVVVARILSIAPHENSDHLQICQMDIGTGTPTQIVTGAQNVFEGAIVPAALPVAKLPGGVVIKAGKLRGVESNGMLCSIAELGLTEHDMPGAATDGILILDESYADMIGKDIREALMLRDSVVEFEITSNRPDCLSVIGLARETAVSFDRELKLHTPVVKAEGAGDVKDYISVEISAPDLCYRYAARVVKNVKVEPSPLWLRMRLRASGVRPINNIVDITNYVMLAVGQPTHVFDSNHIVNHIEVRRANAGEKLQLLNDKELELTADDLVIADAEGAVALAGVMGGAKDSVLPETNSVILEVANFDSRTVRRTALRYDNRTEASSRYEKAIDPERCDQALSLAMQLFAELYPDMKVTAFTDKYPTKLARQEIDVDFDWLDRRLGIRVPEEIVKKKLGTMGFDVTYTDEGMHIVVPTWRSTGDVSIKADIMEEVARMYGYENFQPTPITTSFDSAINQLEMDLVRKVKEYLAFRAGMQEIFTYPWMTDNFVNAILPNICKAVVKNERNFDEFAIFEEAQIFRDTDYTSEYSEIEKLPYQRKHLGCAFAGKSDDIGTLFRRAKGIIEDMPRYTHMEGFTFAKVEKPYWADETVWLNVFLGDTKIGDIALLSKKAALACDIKVLSAILVELDMDAFKPLKSRTNRFVRVPEYPMNEYDISFLVDSSVKWSEIYSAVLPKKSDDNLLREVLFVDEYKGKQIPEGKKSITLRLVIGSGEKTLTGPEIESVANSARKKLTKAFGVDVRTV